MLAAYYGSRDWNPALRDLRTSGRQSAGSPLVISNKILTLLTYPSNGRGIEWLRIKREMWLWI